MEVFIFIVIGLMFGIASYTVAPEGKKEIAAIFGLLFGPVGLIVAALMKED